MNKIIFTAIFALTLVVTTTAQQTKFTALGGLTTATSKLNISGNDFDGSAIGFHIGGRAEISFNDKWSFQPALLYTALVDTDDEVSDETLDLIQVPLFAKYYAYDTFYVTAGPQVTYTFEDDIDTDNFTRFNVGVGIGLGYEFKNGIIIETRSVYQLNNYYTGDEDITSRINLGNLSIGYKF